MVLNKINIINSVILLNALERLKMYDIKMCFPWLKIDTAFLFVQKNAKVAWD